MAGRLLHIHTPRPPRRPSPLTHLNERLCLTYCTHSARSQPAFPPSHLWPVRCSRLEMSLKKIEYFGLVDQSSSPEMGSSADLDAERQPDSWLGPTPLTVVRPLFSSEGTLSTWESPRAGWGLPFKG